MSELIHLTSSKKECSGDVLVRAFTRDQDRSVTHLLTPKNLAIRAKALGQARPSLLDSGEVLLAIQYTMIDPPCQSEAEEACPAGFRVRKLVRIVKVHAPQAIGSLALDQFRRLPLEDLEVAFPAGMIPGQILENPCDSCKHPPIPA